MEAEETSQTKQWLFKNWCPGKQCHPWEEPALLEGLCVNCLTLKSWYSSLQPWLNKWQAGEKRRSGGRDEQKSGNGREKWVGSGRGVGCPWRLRSREVYSSQLSLKARCYTICISGTQNQHSLQVTRVRGQHFHDDFLVGELFCMLHVPYKS